MTKPTPEEALRALGLTPETVAASLYARGIKGVPNRSDRCPLAVYLQTECGYEVCVCSHHISYVEPSGLEVVYRLPEHVELFVSSFDLECYPELDSLDVE